MVKAFFVTACVLVAGTAFAAPAKPLLVLFTNDGTDALTLRTKQTVLALRDAFNDSGIVDVVVYAPDNALFVRALLESKIKPANPLNPTENERYELAKAAGATYCGFVVSGLPNNTTPGAIDVELRTEQVDGRKQWRGRGSFGATGKSAGKYDNAILSVANTLMQDFLRGPLHDLAQSPAPSLSTPIPTERSPVGSGSSSASGVTAPVPMTAPAPRVAPVPPREPLPSSGGDTDNAAEAQRHQGDEQTRAGDATGAIQSYRKAVSLSPLNLQYRVSLAGAYLLAGRRGDALVEAKRAISVVPDTDTEGKAKASKMIAEVLTQSGDMAAARSTYEEFLRTAPDATWAMVGLADVLATEGKTDEAVTLYKRARQTDSADKEVALGLARLLATTGNYDGALRELSAATGGQNSDARYATVRSLFDDEVQKIAERARLNRAAWEAKRISQEVFYKATAAQSSKISGLVALLKAAPPAESATATVKRDHRKRIFAASLLLQGVASLLTQVETGDKNAGADATVFLDEFGREMQGVQNR